MNSDTDFTVDTLHVEDFDRYIDQLAEMYHEAVMNGAVMSQNSDFTVDQALEYWLSLRNDFQNSRKILLMACIPPTNDDEVPTVIGAVQVVLDQKANLRHHSSIEKLMVTPLYQGHGVATNLLRLAEQKARHGNRTIVTLGTSSKVMAEISKHLGYTLYGTIPEFVLTPKDELVDTYFFYKKL